MVVDFIIVGQGIAGTLMSFFLSDAGQTALVIDNAQTDTASYTAAAVINPFNTKGESIKEYHERYLPVALATYTRLGSVLDERLLNETRLFLFSELDVESGGRYTCPSATQANDLGRYFQPFGSIVVRQPCWLIDGPNLLKSWRKRLLKSHLYLNEQFDLQEMRLGNGSVTYKSIKAKRVIFCDGAQGPNNFYESHLRFTRNKGEALIVEIPGLPTTGIYHKDVRLVPWRNGLFWAGSNYDWHFTTAEPTPAFRTETEHKLRSWLSVPFTVKDHIAALRPTVAGQKVFAGIHPSHREVAILNGLGTRGFSQGPYYAQSLVRLLLSV